jgi:hypothetical protein
MTDFFSKCQTGLDRTNDYELVGEIYRKNTESQLKHRSITTVIFGSTGGIPNTREYRDEQKMWPDKCQVCGKGSVNQICVACKPAWSRGLVKTKVPSLDYKTYTHVLSDSTLRDTMSNFRRNTGADPKKFTMSPKTYRSLYTSYMINFYTTGPTPNRSELYGVPVVIDRMMPEGEVRVYKRDRTIPADHLRGIPSTIPPASVRISYNGGP